MSSHRAEAFGLFLLTGLLAALLCLGCGGDGNGNGDDCGNGTIDTGEDCDGTELGGATCADQGFEGGTLACSADCTFDTSGCEGGGDTFQVLAADKSLWQTHNDAYTWGEDTVAIRYLAGPTHAEADKALFFQNPGLYKDTSGEPQITPDPLPDIQGGTATGFDFPMTSGDHAGEQVLDVATIADSLADTPVSAAEQQASLLWEPAVTIHLVAWDIEKSENLYYADNAIKAQKWGSAATLPPQSAWHLYLHGSDIWVEVAFEAHLQLGAGVTDSNGDGYREIFAKVNPALFDADVHAALSGDYTSHKYDETAFAELIAGGTEEGILDKLYSRFPMQPHSNIGEPYDVPGLGTIQYPFMVIKGMAPKDDHVIVLLVEP